MTRMNKKIIIAVGVLLVGIVAGLAVAYGLPLSNTYCGQFSGNSGAWGLESEESLQCREKGCTVEIVPDSDTLPIATDVGHDFECRATPFKKLPLAKSFRKYFGIETPEDIREAEWEAVLERERN